MEQSVRGTSAWDHRASERLVFDSSVAHDWHSEGQPWRERDVEPEVLVGSSALETRFEGDTISLFGAGIPACIIEANRSEAPLSVLTNPTRHATTPASDSLHSDQLLCHPSSRLTDPEKTHEEGLDSEREPAQISRRQLAAITSQPTLLPHRDATTGIATTATTTSKNHSMGLSSARDPLSWNQPTEASPSPSWSWRQQQEQQQHLMHSYRSSSSNNAYPFTDEDKMEEATAQTMTSMSLQKEDDDTIDSATVSSPLGAHAVAPQLQPPSLHVRVPSTSSTAASTVNDEASYHQHYRSPSWDSIEHLHHSFPSLNGASTSPSFPQAWQQQSQPERQLFRNEPGVVLSDNRWQQQQQQGQHYLPPSQQQRGPPQHAFVGPRLPPTHPSDARLRTATTMPFQQTLQPTFSQLQQQSQQQRRPSGGHGPTTPTRQAVASHNQQVHTPGHSHTRPTHRGQSSQPSSPMHQPSTPGPSGARSSSEVLKTLLRKKACLYEPDTSRAVALVTWLVARELALEFGFFSRQQLQAGVHACVASKIDSGLITRTKVNRCMQIILNSCFHYIIPRPDGTEENGSLFRKTFAQEASDNDAALLEILPEAWKNLVVQRDEVLRAVFDLEDGSSQTTMCMTPTRPQQGMVTPHQSPRLVSQIPDKSPCAQSLDGEASDQHKRAVLLCFNENVRTAEDVFRCHNEFIRDMAHASHLQLSAQEWRHFFGNEAASCPNLWGNVGIPVPFSEFHGSSHMDAPGRMAPEEVCKFRTSWCTKRYEHDHDLCGFAHVDVNGGWLRRNPRYHAYKDEMCQAISMVVDQRAKDQCYVIHECPLGNACHYAHSMEEMMYHPRRYKTRVCSSAGRTGGCHLGEVCSNFHPTETYRFPKKNDGRSSRHGKHAHHPSNSAGGTKAQGLVPAPSPILYCDPAPVSSFEEHLSLPGLQNLFRRQCFVVRNHLRKSGNCPCCYSNFGDESGVQDPTSIRITKTPARGLPAPIVRR